MAEKESLYLDKVEFDPELNKSILAMLLRNVRLIVLILLAIVGLGIYAFYSLPREVNPEVKLPYVIVSVVYPGASPETVEDQIIKPIEDNIESIDGIDQVISSANQGSAVVSILFSNNVSTNDALDEVKNRVDLTVLPEDATDPIVQTVDFSKIPVLNIVLVGDLDRIDLSKIAKDLKSKLEDLGSVDEVGTFGLTEEEIVIDLKLDRVQALGISPAQIIQILQSNDINFPPGELNVDEVTYNLSIDNTFKSIEDIREQVLNINGQPIPLSEIAEVRNLTSDLDSFAFHQAKGQEAKTSIELQIFKTSGEPIDRAVDDSIELLNKELEAYPQVEFIEIENQKTNINKQFGDLYDDLITTVILVFTILMIFIGARQALIASLAVPFTFISVLIVLMLIDLSLNFLSIFSLLLALGLVIDDAIVMVTAFTSYFKSGKFSAVEAGLLVYRDFKIPIYATTITTSWAFLPLLLSGGIIGEFIKTIPIVVSSSLLTSTTLAIFVNLPLIVLLNSAKVPSRVKTFVKFVLALIVTILLGVLFFADPSGKTQANAGLLLSKLALFTIFTIFIWFNLFKRRNISLKPKHINSQRFQKIQSKFEPLWATGIVDFTPLKNRYKKLLQSILYDKKRSILTLIICGLFLLISIAFLVSGKLKNEFFPASDSEIVFVNIEGPSGWNYERLTEEVAPITAAMQEVNEIEFVSIVYGSIIGNDGGNLAGDNYAFLKLNLYPLSERSIDSQELTNQLNEEFLKYKEVKVSALNINGGGPPAGADIQINLTGEDLNELENLSNQIVAILQESGKAINISSSLKASAGQIRVDLNSAEMAKRGISAIEVAGWLRTFVEGSSVGEIGVSDNKVDIILKSSDASQIDRLENLVIPSAQGSYALNEIANIRLEPNPESIQRQDGNRIVSVTASSQGTSSTELLKEIEPKINEIEFPFGYEWSVGGVNEENQESIVSILQQMILSFVLILVTMVVQFNSFRKALLVLSIIPIAIAGVFFNFTILGIPLSFPALIGIMALFGIVIYNSIILVEKISQIHSLGVSFTEGIIDVCSSRLQAIFFTSFISIISLLPITISDPLWRGLGGAIISGLSVSGILILIVLPVLYKFIFQGEYTNSSNSE